MSRLTAHKSYRYWAPAIVMNVFLLGFAGFSLADEASSYESYFGDEVTSATCDGEGDEEVPALEAVCSLEYVAIVGGGDASAAVCTEGCIDSNAAASAVGGVGEVAR